MQRRASRVDDEETRVHRTRERRAHVSVLITAILIAGASHALEPAGDGESTLGALEATFQARCGSCHDHPTGRAPSRSALAFVPPGIIARSLKSGTMRPMAEGLGDETIGQLASALSALPMREPVFLPPACTGDPPRRPALASNDWPTTSRVLENTRFQPSPGLTAGDVARLELAWTLAIPDGAPGSPVVADGTLYLPTGSGLVAAIDIERRCTSWTHEHGRIVRTLTLARAGADDAGVRVYFADDLGRATALDASTGRELWRTSVEDHPLARATAAPVEFDGLVYVAMSSIEDPLTHDPTHRCCTSRGSVSALSADTGVVVWKRYMIEQEPQPATSDASKEGERFGPAGASIYTPLAIDARRGRLYATTAESYTNDDPPGSYSVVALDLKTGERAWERQFLPGAADRARICEQDGYTDCRNMFSMGTSVSIHRARNADERDILLVGQKSGVMYGLDPDQRGATRWQRQIAKGGDMGGLMYGFADDGEKVYVPISDLYAKRPDRAGDLVALDPSTGATRWRAEQPDPVCSWGEQACVGAQVAAPTAIPGVVFASAWDGHVRAHSAQDGRLLWEFDTGREFDAINGTARGGQIGAYPIQVVDGLVFVTSGASSQAMPGNLLLVFRPSTR